MNDHGKLEKMRGDIQEYINTLEKYNGDIHTKKVIAELNKIMEPKEA